MTLSLPLLAADFRFDQGVFATIADVMLQGGTAYRDAWEFKPPGIFIVYWVAFLAIARDIWSVRLIEVIALGITSWGLVRLSYRWFGRRAPGIIAATILPLLHLTVAPNSAEPETFQMPLLVWALAFWPRPSEIRSQVARLWCAGALVGMALLLKQTAIFFGAVLALDCLLVGDGGWRNWRPRCKAFVAYSAGIIVPLALVSLHYGIRGAFADLMDATVFFPLQYSSHDSIPSPSYHLQRCLEGLARRTPPPLLLAIAVSVCHAFRHHPENTARWLVLLLANFAVLILQGKYFAYHYDPLLPLLALGVGMSVSEPAGEAGGGREGRDQKVRLAMRAAWVILLAVTVPLLLSDLLPKFRSLGTLARITPDPDPWSPTIEDTYAHRSLVARRAAKRVQSLTSPGDSIFVWGQDPLVYFYAGRRMAGRYPHLRPIAATWSDGTHLQDFLQAMCADPPRLIVVSSGQVWWRNYIPANVLLDDFPLFKGMIENEYTLSLEDNGFSFWTRNN